jgi:hypothetical protein
MNRKTSLNYLIILLLAMTWATSLAAEKKDMPKEDVIEVPAIIKRICFTPTPYASRHACSRTDAGGLLLGVLIVLLTE